MKKGRFELDERDKIMIKEVKAFLKADVESAMVYMDESVTAQSNIIAYNKICERLGVKGITFFQSQYRVYIAREGEYESKKLYAVYDKDYDTILFSGTIMELSEYTGKKPNAIVSAISHAKKRGTNCRYAVLGRGVDIE